MSRGNPHWGTTLDEFLGEEGIREATKAEALTRVAAWQLFQEMERIVRFQATPPRRSSTSAGTSPGRRAFALRLPWIIIR